MKRHFFVPGDPMGKQRVRVANGHAYTPQKTREYEETIRFFYEAQCHYEPYPKGTALGLTIIALFRIPKGASKKTMQGMLSGAIKPTVKPDADNIAKVLDAVNKAAWFDDCQITDLHVKKRYALEPGLDVYITEDDE